MIPPAAGATAPAAEAAAPVVAPTMEPSEPQPTTHPGFDARSEGRKRPEPAAARPAPEKQRQPQRQTPIWTYVGMGFLFGLILLGVYQVYGILAH